MVGMDRDDLAEIIGAFRTHRTFEAEKIRLVTVASKTVGVDGRVPSGAR